MKTKIFSALLIPAVLVIMQLSAGAGTMDTIRHYHPGAGSTAFSYPVQIARFDLPGPSIIRSLILTLGGSSSTGSVKVNLYGHEGGDAIPQLKQALMPPVVLHKSMSGEQRVQYDLTTPVRLSNNHFFIQVSDFSAYTSLVSDNVNQTGLCLGGSSGGDFYFQFFQTSGGTLYYGTKAFKIDVIIEREELPVPSWFEDITAQSGILSDAGSSRGIAVGDFNNDGYQDLIRRNLLYKNEHGHFTDITASAGISGSPWANAFADMDNDGLLDIIYILDTAIIIFRNNGNETFTSNVAATSNVNSGYTATQTFSIADIDNDDFPDIFIGRLWNTYPTALPNYLYRNNGDLTLHDTTKALYPNPANNTRRTRASQFADFDDDGLMDLYVTNYYLEKDELWHNNGNMSFNNVITQKQIDLNTNGGGANHGTGVAWADYDNDLDLDLLLPQFAHPAFVVQYSHQGTTLYRNEGPPAYHFTDLEGAPDPSNDIQFEETHAGACWADVNNDALLDFYITNFYSCRYSDLYIQNSSHQFEVNTQYYLPSQEINTGEDCLFFDIDNDGRSDLVAGEVCSYIKLFKNNDPSGNNYVDIVLRSTTENKFALGARAYVYVNGQTYMREVSTGRGAKMGDPYVLHFGLGRNSSVDSVVVKWPGFQNDDTFTNLIANNINVLCEGGNISYLGNTIDLAPEALLLPVSGCGHSAVENITARIRNFGSDTAYSFQASYGINGVYIAPEMVASAIVPGGYTDYTFTAKADLSAAGSYDFTLAVSISADSNHFNDTLRNARIHNGPIVLLPDSTLICVGDTAAFSAEIGYPAQYAWSDPFQTTTSFIELSQTGLYYVTVTDSCGNLLVDSLYLGVSSIPIVNFGNDTIVGSSNFTLDAGNPGAAYYWSNGEVVQTITVSASGTYAVSVYQGECMSADTIHVTIASGIESADDMAGVFYYPNPVRDILNIDLSTYDPDEKIEIRFLDMTGRVVEIFEFNGGYELQTIDVRSFVSGVYFITLNTPAGTRCFRVAVL